MFTDVTVSRKMTGNLFKSIISSVVPCMDGSADIRRGPPCASGEDTGEMI